MNPRRLKCCGQRWCSPDRFCGRWYTVLGYPQLLRFEANLAYPVELQGKSGVLFGVTNHSIAYANREDLEGDFSKTSRQGFQTALEISAYSLLPIARHAAPLMENGDSIVALTFQASEWLYPGYNVIRTAKVALFLCGDLSNGITGVTIPVDAGYHIMGV